MKLCSFRKTVILFIMSFDHPPPRPKKHHTKQKYLFQGKKSIHMVIYETWKKNNFKINKQNKTLWAKIKQMEFSIYLNSKAKQLNITINYKL